MSKSRTVRTGVVLVSLAMIAGAPGCYRKVVSAKGIGADEIAPRREQPTTSVIQDLGDAVRGEKR